MTNDLSKNVRPLEWREFESGALIADAPLFGRIRVENLGPGNTWAVFYSVPRHSDRLMGGCFDTPREARDAAQAYHASRILATIDIDALIAYGVREGLAMAQGDSDYCAKCGAPRSNHPYRHLFVSTGRLTTDPDAIAAAVARVKGGRDDE